MPTFLNSTKVHFLPLSCVLAIGAWSSAAHAVSSGELYTSASYQYGRFDARIQFGAGDGVVGAYFLWKDGSEKSDVFWNELDFEKVEADCHLESNAFYGLPERTHTEGYESLGDLCGTFHTYTYEWTPEYIAWLVDGTEIRRETGEAVQAFAENAAGGMQVRFNLWPGDSSFGGNFDPAILPVHQYINWVQYSAYVNGAFELQWREDFSAATRPSGWLAGSWDSPKGLSTHKSSNVTFAGGYAIISLTADDALGSVGAMPMDPEGPGPLPETGGAGGGPSTTAGAAGGGAAGLPAVAPMEDDTASEGGCSVQTSQGEQSPWLLLGLAGAAASWRRRRARPSR